MTTPRHSFEDMAADAATTADSAVRNAAVYRPVAQDEVVDPSPVLAGQGPAFETTTPDNDVSDEGTVDLSDIPPFRDLSRELPSQRYLVTADAVDVIRLIPEELLKAGTTSADEVTDGVEGIDLSLLDRVSGMREAIPAAEKFVIGLAENQDDMREWLIRRGSVQVLMAAFNLAQAHAKN